MIMVGSFDADDAIWFTNEIHTMIACDRQNVLLISDDRGDDDLTLLKFLD